VLSQDIQRGLQRRKRRELGLISIEQTTVVKVTHETVREDCIKVRRLVDAVVHDKINCQRPYCEWWLNAIEIVQVYPRTFVRGYSFSFLYDEHGRRLGLDQGELYTCKPSMGLWRLNDT
jgi:hypothetical protein